MRTHQRLISCLVTQPISNWDYKKNNQNARFHTSNTAFIVVSWNNTRQLSSLWLVYKGATSKNSKNDAQVGGNNLIALIVSFNKIKGSFRRHLAHGIWERKIRMYHTWHTNLTWTRWRPCYEFADSLDTTNKLGSFSNKNSKFILRLNVLRNLFSPKIQFFRHFTLKCDILLCHRLIKWHLTLMSTNSQTEQAIQISFLNLQGMVNFLFNRLQVCR